MNFNIQGITGKIQNLEVILTEHNIDIMCVGETWCKTEIEKLSFDNYKVVNFYSRTKFIRGGVCIIAKKELNFKIFECGNICEEKVFEMCCIECILPNNEKVIICALYRSPSADFDVFMEKLSIWMNSASKTGYKYLICGDVNVNMLNVSKNKNARTLINFFDEYNIKQTIFEPTRISETSKSCIDNIFTDLVDFSTLVLDNEISDHTFQILSLNLEQKNINNDVAKLGRSFSKHNIDLFKAEISLVNWNELLDTDTNLNSRFSIFNEKFLEIFNNCFPVISLKPKRYKNKNNWMTPELRELSKLVKEMASLTKKINNISYTTRYMTLKKYYNKKIAYEKRCYNDKRIENATNINKECWNIINENSNKNNGNNLKDVQDLNGQSFQNCKEKCNAFNTFFANVANNSSAPISNEHDLNNSLQQSFYLYPTTPKEISDVIKKVCTKKSCGVDNVPGNILIEIHNVIALPLSILINASFLEGTYPDVLKCSRVVPIYKNKGDKHSIKNYRPVSLQCHFGKIFEYCFNARLNSYLEKYNILSNSQNGFRANHSTYTALDHAITHIHESLNNKNQIMGLFFDMSRAFDTVDHNLLITKLYHIGIRGSASDWVKTYLSGRTQQVEIDTTRSDIIEITTGTPQGSCLSPTLFNVFINDLPSKLEKYGNPIMYADDTNVIVSGKCVNEIFTKSNDCITTMSNWCKNNGINLNSSKSMAMQFCTKNKNINSSLLLKAEGKSIANVTSTKFLGIYIDQKLTWSIHIENIVSKLSSYCFIIRNIKGTVSNEVLKLLYFGLIQSTISYGIIYWGQAHDALQIFTMQKKVIRYMLGLPMIASCREHFKRLEIMTFPSLYIYSLIIHTRKLNYIQKRKDIHDYDTRTKNDMALPFSRLSVCQQNPRYAGIKMYNKLTNLKEIDNNLKMSRFKAELKKFLICKCYYSVDDFFNDNTTFHNV